MTGDAPAEPLAARIVATSWVAVRRPRDRRFPFRERADVVRLRDARVRELVRYAAEHVPHYRDLFRERGIDARDVAGADDLAKLPLLDKETIQRHPERFRSPVSGVPFPTSGSTGTPLVVVHERGALLRYLSIGVRSDDVARRFIRRSRRTVVRIAHPSSTGVRTRAYYRRATLFPARGMRSQVSPEDPVRAGIDAVNAVKPSIVAGWGGSLESLFRLVAAENVPLHRPKLVSYHSERMTEDGRRLIEEHFGIPVVSNYASVETFRIGFFCERRTGHHLHEDCCHVRVVRADGRDARPGEAGEVVVSNLVNRATVLLNYRLGDIAALLEGPCACGRSLRLLGAVEGRVNEIVVLADGTRVSPISVAGAVRQEGLLRFRLTQEARDRFALEVVTVDDDAYARVAQAALPKVRAVLGGAEVSLVRRDSLRESAREKHRRVLALPES